MTGDAACGLTGDMTGDMCVASSVSCGATRDVTHDGGRRQVSCTHCMSPHQFHKPGSRYLYCIRSHNLWVTPKP